MNVERDHTSVKPYGDTMNDGKVQLSFTLPMEASPEASEAARQLAEKMGLERPETVHTSDLGEGFSFHVLYGNCIHSVDATRIRVARVEFPAMSYYEVNDYITERLGRHLRVVGACTGSDAHTVGLDAIMNMKGYAGEYGLERYPQIDTWNMGSQVENEQFIQTALDVDADALLVSQVVTQKDIHVKNLTALVDLLEAEGLRERFVVVAGGPRISHELALELGLDAGFGTGTHPPEVAGYLAREVVSRRC